MIKRDAYRLCETCLQSYLVTYLEWHKEWEKIKFNYSKLFFFFTQTEDKLFIYKKFCRLNKFGASWRVQQAKNSPSVIRWKVWEALAEFRLPKWKIGRTRTRRPASHENQFATKKNKPILKLHEIDQISPWFPCNHLKHDLWSFSFKVSS